MSKQPHVLFLSAWFPHRKDAMFGLFVKKHAEAVSSYCKVNAIYAKPDSDINKVEIEKKVELFTTYYMYYPEIKVSGPLAIPLKGIAFIKAYFKLFKLLKEEEGKPDIIHANILTRIGFIALLFKIIYGIPYIITEHWSRYLPTTNTYHGWMRKMLTRIVIRNAASISTVTNNLKMAMQNHQLKHSDYFILPNVVSDEFFNSDIKTNKSDRKSILHVSCFEDRSKNVTGIIRTISELKKQRQDFKLVMVGEGEDLQKAQDLCQELSLQDYIEFTGVLVGENLVQRYVDSDFHLMFSHYENMPVVINESLSVGRPVVATNVGGIAEVINSSNGILVESGDQKALLQSINRMLDRLEDYNSKEISDSAKKQYSSEAIGLFLLNKYKQVLNRQ